MSSIGFFVPVVYNNSNKTTSQRVLEAVDEYFYLGNQPRVTIFAPDAKHPQSWAMQNRQERRRSWTNTALKVASYLTIIVPLAPLLTKALLRRSLQVASIQAQGVVPSSEMEARLPPAVVQHITSFLSYQDQAHFAQTALFARNAARDTEQYYTGLMARLNGDIEMILPGPLSKADFQTILVSLVTSPASGHPKHWVPVIDTWMSYLKRKETVPQIIQAHANIAELLATSGRSISPDQTYQLCQYLAHKQLSNIKPWIGYRALEQYSLKPQLNSASVNQALKEYLTQKATVHIRAGNNGYFLPNDRMLQFQETEIDPRMWFGLDTEPNSLFSIQPGFDETGRMPELLLEVLWTHIQSLHAACIDKPFMVRMTGRMEAELPRNFTLTLAQRITNADIFLDHNNTIDLQQIEKEQYARSLGNLSQEEMEALAAEHYPNALVVQRNR